MPTGTGRSGPYGRWRLPCPAPRPGTTGAARPWRDSRSDHGFLGAPGSAGSGRDDEDRGVTRTPTTDEWGIDASWLDAFDEEHQVPQETVRRLREVIGRPSADLEDRAPIVARRGDALEIDAADVLCEDGEVRSIDGEIPADFPFGYHRIRPESGPERRLIVSPGRCWLPDERTWGWAVQLYAARSRGSRGIGDLADLRAIRDMAKAQGAGFVLINPLHAVAPTPVQEASPYLPATRRFRNPVYLRVEEVPGAEGVDLSDAEGRALSDAELIDRDARSEEHTSELQSRQYLVCRLL